VRALAAAEDEHGGSAAALGSYFEKSLAYGNSGDFGAAKIFRGLFEMHRSSRHKSSNDAIGEAWNYIRLEGQRGNVARRFAVARRNLSFAFANPSIGDWHSRGEEDDCTE
jgi:hypothetical protein